MENYPPQVNSAEHAQNPEIVYNINDAVLVKITEEGERIWHDHHASSRVAALRAGYDTSAYDLRRDEEGYTRMVLWEAMQIFGPHIINGKTAPIEMRIKLVPPTPIE